MQTPRVWALPIDGEEDRVLLYEPLAGTAFVGNAAMAALATGGAGANPPSSGDREALRFLDAIGLRRPAARPATRPDQGMRSAVLLTTNDCPLRCTYCYAAAGVQPTRELSIERAVAVIDAVVESARQHGRRSFEVSFHGGGEPTRAWHLIEAATAHARRQPIPATITLTSNAIWSAAQCRWVIEHIDGLTLSIDGAPDTQDRNRPLRTGGGSSAVVWRNVERLEQAHMPYGIRMTATTPWDRLAADVGYLLDHTSCRRLRVEPAFNTERGGHGDPDASDLRAFADAFLAAWDAARSRGADLVYTGADVSAARTRFCSAPDDALVVTPSGDLVTCYEVVDRTHPLAEVSTVGRLDDARVEVDEAQRDHLRSLRAERRDSCRDCFCAWTCAGDCYVRAFRTGPDGHLHRGGACQLNRMLTQELLLRLVAERGGVWQRTRPVVPSTSGEPS